MNNELAGEEEVEVAAQPANDEVIQEDVEEKVPLSALQAERKQRQELQQNMRMLQDHLELLRANSQGSRQEPASTLQDDDVLTVGEAKKYMQAIQNEYKMSVEELKMHQSNPDYGDVVRKYLPAVLEENPELREDILNAKNPYKLGYYLAKNSEQYKSEQRKAKKSEKAERILKNAEQSGSLASVGQTSTSQSNKAWSQMSDEEFMRNVNKNRGYF